MAASYLLSSRRHGTHRPCAPALSWPGSDIALWHCTPLVFAGIPELDPNLLQVLTPATAAVIGLGLISSAYMAEIYRGSLSAVSKGQWEASGSLGMSKLDRQPGWSVRRCCG